MKNYYDKDSPNAISTANSDFMKIIILAEGIMKSSNSHETTIEFTNHMRSKPNGQIELGISGSKFSISHGTEVEQDIGFRITTKKL